jgi:hypothetical protein
MVVITSDEPYNYSWSAPGPPKNANEQAAQSMMQAGIGSLGGNTYDGAASMMSTSPGGNNYYKPNFDIVDQNTTHGMRYTGDTNREEELKSMLFSNSYFTNPITGQKFGHSMSNFQGPNREWSESRYIFPDASGIGQRWDSEGNESEYPIRLKGPQTWNYDPGNYGGDDSEDYVTDIDYEVEEPVEERGTGLWSLLRGKNPLNLGMMEDMFRRQTMENLNRRMMEDMLMNPNEFNTLPGTGDINPIFGNPYWNI